MSNVLNPKSVFSCSYGLSCAAIAMGFASVALSSPPLDPLPAPFYSFDQSSPSVDGPKATARADELLQLFTPDLVPITVLSAANLGLNQQGDDLDAVSFSKGAIMPTEEFIFMFAVDRDSTGDVPPDPLLLASEVAFNVADQANRGHAAGDAFVTLKNFTVDGSVNRSLRSGPPPSNTQARNQFDEGGHDFGGEPDTGSRDYMLGEQDSVDGLAFETPASAPGSRGARSARGVPVPQPLYYSVTSASPSLATLPVSGGADILYHPDPRQTGIPPQQFADAATLGLLPNDEVDALVALDHDDNGLFNSGDLLFLSLAPGSPSLTGATAIPNISPNGAADILAVRFVDPTTVVIEVFASAAELGLLGASDNVDALEIVFCSDPTICGQGVGIRLIHGDWNNDAAVNILDVPDLMPCMAGPGDMSKGAGFDPLCLDVFDYDIDGKVDLHDFQEFQSVFTP